MDVRIGVTYSPKELDLDLGDDDDRAALKKDIEAALGDDDTAFSFGYADGYLGTTHKLPAQIRYEGTTCTPP